MYYKFITIKLRKKYKIRTYIILLIPHVAIYLNIFIVHIYSDLDLQADDALLEFLLLHSTSVDDPILIIQDADFEKNILSLYCIFFFLLARITHHIVISIDSNISKTKDPPTLPPALAATLPLEDDTPKYVGCM